ncbi:MerR family DNA-binding protein [Roseomonas sp. NAR14]|uniref:MerR family DNA-binding protein n=1 Tax=Roseomonas acroporae TaxID=2937791 RepID=A0A9X1Y9S2_9PROT|nr:MerR family DNA-binding protein [Roseomonas acroporae]
MKRLEKIAALKRLGLDLGEIAQVIDLYFVDPIGLRGKEKVLEILERHQAETTARLRELGRFREELDANIARMRRLIAELQGDATAV